VDIFEEIVAAKKAHMPIVLATVIESLGSAPREEGARMLIKADGSTVGTIGGGAIEKVIADHAVELMNATSPQLVRYNLKDIGMSCGGAMSIFLEPLHPAPRLIIFGAGHIGAALAQIGKMLDFTVVVVDNRPEYASRERLPWADTVIAGDYQSALQSVLPLDTAYVIIVTHKHAHDFEVLEQCVQKPFHYLGMIGSKTKVAKAFQQLREKGIDESIIQQIHAPIGIDIGANAPAEIALSIAAELVAFRSGTKVAGMQLSAGKE
jgi:xanthine dehydrogenase accessory factor